MKVEFIKELAMLLQENDINELDYTYNSERIRLVKNTTLKSDIEDIYFKNQNNFKLFEERKTEEIPQNVSHEEDNIKLGMDLDTEKIKASMIGTFYSKPSPDETEFVNVGSTVKKGDVIGIIESMKLMNEIKAPFDCEIIQILVDEEEVVEFGQELFEVKVI
ncbi:acetyl-CoA carboxylase biotin carboxyl carrier protein [Peptostreptococcus canis]|nr:biotin/lipoyl-containing protein [Peptostreptococcus canis]MBP1998067.1 acetyl-CoA carboxylase biotin carboxyl carrier protein [Peptostreptococcus canis]